MYRPSLPSSDWEDKVSNPRTLIRSFFINSLIDWSLGIWITPEARSMKSLVKSRTCIRCGNSFIEHSVSSAKVGFSATDKCEIKNHLIHVDKYLHLSHLNLGVFFHKRESNIKIVVILLFAGCQERKRKEIIWIRMNALI